MSVLLIILGFVLFVGLVVLHELGHFLVARRNGVEVEEFGLGFPPRAKILGKKNGTVYTLNWLPLGGFVKLKGEHDSDTAPGTFGAVNLWAKIKIMMAGVVVNALTAFAMLTVLAAVGMPQIIENQFTVARDTKVVRLDVLAAYIEPDSPAEKAGLKEQDELKLITPVDTELSTKELISGAKTFSESTEKLAGHQVRIDYERNGEPRSTNTTLREKEEVEKSKSEAATQNNPELQKGYLGIVPAEYIVQRSTWSSPVVAVGFMKQVTEATFKGIGSALAGLFQGDTEKASSQVAGIVGIGYVIGKGSALGLQFILLIIAVISLTLAIMNALPIPALDGGRLFVTLLFRAIKKPLTERKEEWIHGTGFVVLMLLFLVITWVDINRIT